MSTKQSNFNGSVASSRMSEVKNNALFDSFNTDQYPGSVKNSIHLGNNDSMSNYDFASSASFTTTDMSSFMQEFESDSEKINYCPIFGIPFIDMSF